MKNYSQKTISKLLSKLKYPENFTVEEKRNNFAYVCLNCEQKFWGDIIPNTNIERADSHWERNHV